MNKVSVSDWIPAELFQILKDDAVKVLHSICQQIWKTQQWPQDWKRSAFIPIPKTDSTKEYSNYCTIVLIFCASKVMLKILQGRLQQYMNWACLDVQAGFRKGEEKEIKLPTSIESQKKQVNSRKTPTSVSLTMLKPLTVWINNKLWKSLKEMGMPDHHTCLLRNLYAGQEAIVRIRHGKVDWFKIGKGVHQGCQWVYCHPAYLTYIQSTSCKIPGWLTSWNQDYWEKYQQPQICRWYNSNGIKQRGTKELLIRVKEESEKSGLKLSVQRTKIMASSPTTSWKIDGEKVETVTYFIFLGSKIKSL